MSRRNIRVEDSGICLQRGVRGAVNRFLARHVAAILSVPGRRLLRRFERAARDVAGAQDRVLRDIVRLCAHTAFGREHGFDRIADATDYRQRVPIRDYEDFRPYVNRCAEGESDVLFPGAPLMFTRTSGTTAEPKLIPISRINFERTIVQRGKLWLYNLHRQFPGIYDGKDVSLVSPAEAGRTAQGVPFGALSGLIYRNIPDFVKHVHSVPYPVFCAADYQARAYGVLRFGVPSDITCILTGNPATVLNLAQKAETWQESLIRDVHDGTLHPPGDMDADTLAFLRSLLRPAPRRAAQLEAVAAGPHGFTPKGYWPNLRLIHTWTNGNCARVVPELRPWYGDVPILDFGYIASEITAADMVDPATGASYLAVLSGFYEFVPEEEIEAPSRTLLAHELEVGKRYEVVVTTYSGLYRYNMRDIVEVVGHHHQVPLIRFLYKSNGVTSLQGEKLSEDHVIAAVQRAGEATGTAPGFFVVVPDAARNCYRLYVSLPAAEAGRIDGFARAVDEALCAVNEEYAAKRHSERLEAVVPILLVPDAFERFRSLRLDEGAFEGQLKWLHLSADPVVQQRMEKLRAEASD